MPQSISTNFKKKKTQESASKKRLKVNLISETPFTVQGHGVHTAFVESCDALIKIGVEAKKNSREICDITHIHTVGPYSLFKCLKSKGKVVITAHVVPASFVGSLVLSRLWLPLATLYLKFFYNRADAIIAVSPQVKKELERLGIRKKIYFIPNGVSLDKFKKNPQKRPLIRKKFNIKEDDFVVMDSGQIQPRKGIGTFINTAKELPEIKFLWVGGMPFSWLGANYREMKKIQKLAPPNVIFAGIVPFDQMPSYYDAADILFFPSYQENFPFAIIEAAASKLPLLLRDLDIYEPIFDDNFLKGNEENFKNYILKLKANTDFYQEYSNRAYKVAERYEDVKLAKELVKVYKSLRD